MVLGCLCVAPVVAIGFVILIVYLSQQSRRRAVSENLTQCPDCGREVSLLAPTCPHCGRPLKSSPPTSSP